MAKLFPYRDSNGRLLFRGKVGCKKADGVTEGVSKFFPVRVGGRLLLRGKGPDGKILWGYPYRDSEGRLMGRTRGPTSPCGCPSCHIVVTLSGLPNYWNVGGMLTDFTGLNGTHTLTLASNRRYYYKTPADFDWEPCSECTVAETFPAAGRGIGPRIVFDTGVIDFTVGGIEILGRSPDAYYYPYKIYIYNTLHGCGDLAKWIGYTWYSTWPQPYCKVRLDAML